MDNCLKIHKYHKLFKLRDFHIAKTIYAILSNLLSAKQAFELGENASFDAVKAHKSFSRKLVNEVIDKSNAIEIPAFNDILEKGKIPDDYKDKACLAYTHILEDSNKDDDFFYRTFKKLQKLIKNFDHISGETLWDYAGDVSKNILTIIGKMYM